MYKRWKEFVLIRSSSETVPSMKDMVDFTITTKMKYKVKNAGKLFNQECPACLEPFTPKTRIALFPCRHAMCLDCSRKWLVQSNECASCRNAAVR